MPPGDLRFTAKRFTLSTADEERNVVVGAPWPVERVRTIGVQPGSYRVIDGQLCRVVDALPPLLEALIAK